MGDRDGYWLLSLDYFLLLHRFGTAGGVAELDHNRPSCRGGTLTSSIKDK